jgi:protein-disulfide isomerase
MKSSLTIPMAIVVGGIIVAAAVYFSVPRQTPAVHTGNPSLVRPISTADHILGNPAASVFIVEYADFDCTFCATSNQTLRQLVANEGGGTKVALVFREFPLTELHPNALSHAQAAECVAQTAGNDAFWKFTDELFTHQPVDPARYGEFAKAAGVIGDSFATCFSTASTTMSARITADRQNALDAGAQGTPYSLIVVAGQAPIVMNGAYSYDAAKALVDTALASTH